MRTRFNGKRRPRRNKRTDGGAAFPDQSNDVVKDSGVDGGSDNPEDGEEGDNLAVQGSRHQHSELPAADEYEEAKEDEEDEEAGFFHETEAAIYNEAGEAAEIPDLMTRINRETVRILQHLCPLRQQSAAPEAEIAGGSGPASPLPDATLAIDASRPPVRQSPPAWQVTIEDDDDDIEQGTVLWVGEGAAKKRKFYVRGEVRVNGALTFDGDVSLTQATKKRKEGEGDGRKV